MALTIACLGAGFLLAMFFLAVVDVWTERD